MKRVFLFFALVAITLSVAAGSKKEHTKAVIDSVEKAKVQFQQMDQQKEQGKKRGYSNQFNQRVIKDSAQFFVGGSDTIFITKNGIPLSYDTVGTVIVHDRRIFLLPGQMGLYIKSRQHTISKDTIWISFYYGPKNAIIDIPFMPDGTAPNNIFVLSGLQTIVDADNGETYFFTISKDTYQIVRGIGTPLLIDMDVEKDFSAAKDMKIHKLTMESAGTQTRVSTDGVRPALMPIQK